MKNYVISLTTESTRRQHIQRQFSEQGIAFDFFDAIQPIDNKLIADRLNISSAAAEFLSIGEFSCLLSHVSLWQKALSEDFEYIAIYEDDIHLGVRAAEFLKDSLWIPQGCHVLKLEAFYEQVFVSKSKQYRCAGERSLFELKSKHVGGAGYILSRHAAKVLLNEVQQARRLKPVDHIIFDDYIFSDQLQIFQLLPALCIQDYLYNSKQHQLVSALEPARRQRFKQQSKQSCAVLKLKKELLRLLVPIQRLNKSFIYLRKTVEFR